MSKKKKGGHKKSQAVKLECKRAHKCVIPRIG